MNEAAFIRAMQVFHKSHTGIADALRTAIQVYQDEERKRLVRVRAESLEIHMADTDAGKNTALVFTGFQNAGEIESFVREFIYASSK